MRLLELAGRPLDPERPYLIAEAGVNHEGSLARAIEMVDAAAESGADMIKFQSYKASRLASRNSPAYWDRSKEAAASQYELFERFDALDVEDYRKLHERCRERGIAFASTAFDAVFVEALDPLLCCHKVASADIDNLPLLRRIAACQKPVLLSTGASTPAEIHTALGWLRDHGAPAVALLHCVLQYPTAPENANLGVIRYLAAAFPDCTIGYSDHVPPGDGCLALLLAWLEGAWILEKHFTLDKSLPGNDHYHAMDPDDIAAFRRRCESVRVLRGAAEKRVLPCELAARQHARRSLVAARDIARGEVIREDALTAKRPGHGIAPGHIDLLIGRRAPRDIAGDEVLTWERLLDGPEAKTGG